MTDIEFEQIIIKAIYANSSVSSKVVPELNTDWFINVDHKYIVDAILNYNAKFSAVPNVIETRRLLKDERTVTEFNKCMDIADDDVNTPYLLNEIQDFVRKRLLRKVQVDISSYCESNKPGGSFADDAAYAESFTFDDNVGFSFFEEPEKIYNSIITNEKVIPTGCRTLDEMIFGGVHEKSLNLILANTNIGKSLILCSMTTSMVLAGKKVLYVTFEDPEIKIGQRIMQNMFDITQTELKALNKDAYIRLYKKFINQCGHNKLVIKEYPEYCVNSLMIKALMKELKEKKGFVPDVLMIDYMGCMIPDGRPNPNENDNSRLRAIAAQVRSIGMVYGIPVVSAAQSNRGGYGKADVGLDDIADSFASTMKSDAIFGVTQTPEMKAAGMYTVKLLKTRYGMPKMPTTTVGVNIEKQRIYDLKSFGTEDGPENLGANNIQDVIQQPAVQQTQQDSDVNFFTM